MRLLDSLAMSRHQFFLLAISNVSGGLGVFESVIIFLLPESIAVPDILSSLIVYRELRFLLPLAIALISIIYFEIMRKLF